jgi:aspartate aminotransferase
MNSPADSRAASKAAKAAKPAKPAKPRPSLAQRLSWLSPSPTMAVMAEAERLRSQGAKVVDFGAGEPDFDTPESVKEAAHRAIRENFTHYTLNPGIIELRQAVCDRYRADYGLAFDPTEVIVTHGGKHALFDLMMTLLDPGDEVVIPNPHWKTFSEQARLLQAKPVFVETKESDGFRISAELVSAAVTTRTKVVLLNFPSNPAGAMVEPEDLDVLGEMAASHGFYLLWDDAYGRLSYEPLPIAALKMLRENIGDRFLVAGTASKSYAMTGWRLGWAMGPKAVIAGCAKLQSHMTSNASSISQRAALEALRGDSSTVREMVDEYRFRRDRLRAALLSIPGVTCVEPRGGFYLFPGIQSFLGGEVSSATDLAALLLKEEQVAVVPGLAFDREGHFRVSFSTSREEIEEGIARMTRFFSRRLPER